MPLEDYKTLLKGDPNGAWTAHLEAVYLEKFNSSTEVANLYKAKWFKALKPQEQDAEVEKRYLAFVQAIERDKLYHFVMACDQPNPVLIIRSPTETKAIKQFLGYEWSSAKGDEGIKLIKDAHGRPSRRFMKKPTGTTPGSSTSALRRISMARWRPSRRRCRTWRERLRWWRCWISLEQSSKSRSTWRSRAVQKSYPSGPFPR